MAGATWNCCRLGAFCVHQTTTHQWWTWKEMMGDALQKQTKAHCATPWGHAFHHRKVPFLYFRSDGKWVAVHIIPWQQLLRWWCGGCKVRDGRPWFPPWWQIPDHVFLAATISIKQIQSHLQPHKTSLTQVWAQHYQMSSFKPVNCIQHLY